MSDSRPKTVEEKCYDTFIAAITQAKEHTERVAAFAALETDLDDADLPTFMYIAKHYVEGKDKSEARAALKDHLDTRIAALLIEFESSMDEAKEDTEDGASARQEAIKELHENLINYGRGDTGTLLDNINLYIRGKVADLEASETPVPQDTLDKIRSAHKAYLTSIGAGAEEEDGDDDEEEEEDGDDDDNEEEEEDTDDNNKPLETSKPSQKTVVLPAKKPKEIYADFEADVDAILKRFNIPSLARPKPDTGIGNSIKEKKNETTEEPSTTVVGQIEQEKKEITERIKNLHETMHSAGLLARVAGDLNASRFIGNINTYVDKLMSVLRKNFDKDLLTLKSLIMTTALDLDKGKSSLLENVPASASPSLNLNTSPPPTQSSTVAPSPSIPSSTTASLTPITLPPTPLQQPTFSKLDNLHSSGRENIEEKKAEAAVALRDDAIAPPGKRLEFEEEVEEEEEQKFTPPAKYQENQDKDDLPGTLKKYYESFKTSSPENFKRTAEQDSAGKIPFHYLAEKGLAWIMREVTSTLSISHQKDFLFIQDKEGNTPLDIAIKKGQIFAALELMMAMSVRPTPASDCPHISKQHYSKLFKQLSRMDVAKYLIEYFKYIIGNEELSPQQIKNQFIDPVFVRGGNLLNHFLNTNPAIYKTVFEKLYEENLLGDVPLEVMKSIAPTASQKNFIKIIAAHTCRDKPMEEGTPTEVALKGNRLETISTLSKYGKLGCFTPEHLKIVITKGITSNKVEVVASVLSRMDAKARLEDSHHTQLLGQVDDLAKAFVLSMSDIITVEKKLDKEADPNKRLDALEQNIRIQNAKCLKLRDTPMDPNNVLARNQQADLEFELEQLIKLENELRHLKSVAYRKNIEPIEREKNIEILHDLFSGKNLLSRYFLCRHAELKEQPLSILGFADTYHIALTLETLAPEKDGSTFTHLAAKHGVEQYIEGLLKDKSFDSFYMKDALGETPLSLLLKNKKFELAMKVLAYTPATGHPAMVSHLTGLADFTQDSIAIKKLCIAHIEKCRTHDQDKNTDKTSDLLALLNNKENLVYSYLGPDFFLHLEKREKLLQLAAHYRKMSFLAVHSNYEFKNKEDYLEKYTALYQKLQDPEYSDSLESALLRYQLPINLTALGLEKADLMEKIGEAPEQIYLFSKCQKTLDKAAAVPEKLEATFTALKTSGGHGITTDILAYTSDKVQVTVHPAPESASVERFRDEDGGYARFITESYRLPDKDPDLKSWAACAINRFFAAAPEYTDTVQFEDGYTPQQLAALIGYCKVMEYSYEIGPKQQLRMLAQQEATKDRVTDERVHAGKKFELTPPLIAVARSFNESVFMAGHPQYQTKEWQTWLDRPTTRGNHNEVAPLAIETCRTLNNDLGTPIVLALPKVVRPAPLSPPASPSVSSFSLFSPPHTPTTALTRTAPSLTPPPNNSRR